MDFELIYEAIRLLFLLGVPILLAIATVGLFVSSLQAATTIQDQSSSYAVKLIVLIALLYFGLPIAVQALSEFSQICFSGA